MYHTVAYFDATSSTSLAQVAAVTDNIITIRNSNFYMPTRFQMPWAYAGGDDPVRGVLNTPTFRTVSPIELSQLNPTDQPGDLPNVLDYRAMPLNLPAGQEVEAQWQDGTGDTPVAVIAGLTERMEPMPAGQIYTIRATGAGTLVAGAWTNLTLTFADTLPPGRYALVGGFCQSATGIAWRLNIPGQLYRPGGLVITSIGQRISNMFRRGGLGLWGVFENDALPQVELLATAADTACVLNLDIIPMGLAA